MITSKRWGWMLPLFAAALLLGGTPAALAQHEHEHGGGGGFHGGGGGGFHGGGGGGWHGGGWHGGYWHGGGWYGSYWGGPYWGWGWPYYYGYGYPYYDPYDYPYDYGTYPAAPAYQAPAYQAPAPVTQQAPATWYYCSNPSGYYPYVQSCNGPWQPVPATPPGMQ